MNNISKYATCPVINAMSSDNHPCEVISDIYSIQEIRSNYRDLTYTFVGPAGNIAKTWVEAAKVLNLKLQHVCTPENRLCEDGDHYSFSSDLEAMLAGSDVVLTDSLPVEYQTDDYLSRYQINLTRMRLTNAEAILNPCPPFYRGQEVSEEVINSDYFVGHSFKNNLLYVHQAILIHCYETIAGVGIDDGQGCTLQGIARTSGSLQ